MAKYSETKLLETLVRAKMLFEVAKTFGDRFVKLKEYSLVGICKALAYLLDCYDEHGRLDCDYIQEIYPELTYNNAKIVTPTTACGCDNGYFWEYGDMDSRIKFLEWMIEKRKH